MFILFPLLCLLSFDPSSLASGLATGTNRKDGEGADQSKISSAILSPQAQGWQQRHLQGQGVQCEPGAETYTSPGGVTYNCTLPDPDDVCDLWMQASGNALNCTCSKFAQSQVNVQCEDTIPSYNSDKSWCASSTFETVINEKSQLRHASSCASITSADGAEAGIDTCVQVFPLEDGNFNSLERCAATLNGEKCTCTVCTPEEHESINSDNPAAIKSNSSVTVNCCDIMDGALATCSPVGPQGRSLVMFDQLEGDGICSADGVSASSKSSANSLTMNTCGWSTASAALSIFIMFVTYNIGALL